jgi:hypothetical protein
MRINRLRDRLEALRRQMRELQAMERAVADAPDHQVSLTDPDARAMATKGQGHRHGRLQRAGGDGCQAPSDHRARGYERRP